MLRTDDSPHPRGFRPRQGAGGRVDTRGDENKLETTTPGVGDRGDKLSIQRSSHPSWIRIQRRGMALLGHRRRRHVFRDIISSTNKNSFDAL